MADARQVFLERKRKDIERGARTLSILSIVFMVIACVAFGGSVLQLLRLAGPAPWGEVIAGASQTAVGGVSYFLFYWLAKRAANAFEAIAALIQEVGEIV